MWHAWVEGKRDNPWRHILRNAPLMKRTLFSVADFGEGRIEEDRGITTCGCSSMEWRGHERSRTHLHSGVGVVVREGQMRS
jgi:hypothetical protein